MEELEELYREVILDHFQNPRHRGAPSGADVVAEGKNPLCGDELSLHLQFDGDRISSIHWEGRGCSISQASSSMLADALQGKTVAQAEVMIAAVKQMMRDGNLPADLSTGDVEVLAGVRKFPVRVKCALLAWTTLEEGLKDHDHRTKRTNFTF